MNKDDEFFWTYFGGSIHGNTIVITTLHHNSYKSKLGEIPTNNTPEKFFYT